MSEQTETGPIRHFKGNLETLNVDPYLRGEEAGPIWLALHKQIQDDKSPYHDASFDPLSKSERKLYESLTTQFTELAGIGPILVEYNEIKPNEDPQS